MLEKDKCTAKDRTFSTFLYLNAYCKNISKNDLWKFIVDSQGFTFCKDDL